MKIAKKNKLLAIAFTASAITQTLLLLPKNIKKKESKEQSGKKIGC